MSQDDINRDNDEALSDELDEMNTNRQDESALTDDDDTQAM